MKKFVAILFLAPCLIANAQESKISDNFELSNFAITVTVDSMDELDSTFEVSDFKDILEKISPSEPLSFKLRCNDQSKNEHNHISFAIEGNSDEPEKFLEQIKKIKKAAMAYYKNKA